MNHPGTEQGFSASLEQEDGANGGVRACLAGRSRTATSLGTLENSRSQVESSLWHGQGSRRRAGQVFELVEPNVMGGATANSLPQTATGHKRDDQIVKTKPLTRSCLRVLDQSLGPTRARSSRN